jgi:hypothetical protein
MSRAILFILLAAALAACSEAGPYGYGYAVNGRPSLEQLGYAAGGDGNALRAATPPKDNAVVEK